MPDFNIQGYQPVINGLLYEKGNQTIITGTYKLPSPGYIANLLIRTGLVLSGIQRLAEVIDSDDEVDLSVNPIEEMMRFSLPADFIKAIPKDLPNFRKVVKANIPFPYFPNQRYFSVAGGEMDPEIKECLRGQKATYDNFCESHDNLDRQWSIDLAINSDGRPKYNLEELLRFIREHQPVNSKTLRIKTSAPSSINEIEFIQGVYAGTFGELGTHGLYQLPMRHTINTISMIVVKDISLELMEDIARKTDDDEESQSEFTEEDLRVLQETGKLLFGDNPFGIRATDSTKWC
ncbi:MAG TPA: hypothetical protein VJI98_05110 [Candidatus Nanoarchaeia archaeon]|nr:hypothetical protein [Candidatus Nanoarchaeia archaeon]